MLFRSIDDYQPDHLLDMLLTRDGHRLADPRGGRRGGGQAPGYRRAGGRIQAAFARAIRLGPERIRRAR